MVRRVLLALAVLATLPATAHASDLEISQQIARQTFPSPCVGQERVDLGPPLSLNGRPVGGLAHLETCHIELDERLQDVDLCRVLVHEYGHLAGLAHTEGGIMDSGQPDVPACAKLTVLPLLYAREPVYQAVSADRTVTCRRRAPARLEKRYALCTARHKRRRALRYLVTARMPGVLAIKRVR